MIPVTIEALLVGANQEKSVIVLRPIMETGANPRVLPIYIGKTEAVSINAAIEGKKSERPHTHDLLLSIVDALGGDILRIVIDRVDGMSFYSKVVLEQDGEKIEIDARPSDAIAVAVKAQVPVYVESPVFIAASLPFNSQTNTLEESEIEAFHEYVENLDPEDFSNPAEGLSKEE